MAILDGHATAQRRSLAYHRKVAERLDEDIRGRARGLIARWEDEGTLARAYADRWRAVLDLPLAALAAAIVRDDEQMSDLRQCSPFAGVLANRERWAIVREVR
jgi:hypothetical protein